MNITIVLAHPDPESFNHVIAQTAADRLERNGHSVAFHDLYAEKFDPVLPAGEIPSGSTVPDSIERYCRELSRADGIVIVHPNWWGQPPAVLKGWIDRVVRPGVAYRFDETDEGDGVPVGLLQATQAIVFNTANTPHWREQDVFGDPLQLLWKNCVFDLCGVPAFHREMFTVVVTSTSEERNGWLAQVDEIINRCFPTFEPAS